MDVKKPEDGQPGGKPPQEIRIPCPVCKYRKFRSEQAFCDHLQTEHNIFPCQDCDAIYACRDDLARHESEKHGNINYNVKWKLKHKGKSSPVIRSVSLPASENISPTQLPMRLHPQPARARPSTAHARQPSTETRKSPAQIRHSSTLVHQGDQQGRPARAQVFRSPRSPVFHPRHKFRQMRHPLPPRPVNVYQESSQAFQSPGQVPQAPVGFYQASEQDFQPPMGASQVPVGFYQASYQLFLPVGVPGSLGGFYQPPAQFYQTPTPPSHIPSPMYQSPPWGCQNQVKRYRAASQGRRTPTPIYQAHPRRRKNKVQVYRAALQVTQFPEENYQSRQQIWNSQFLSQERQHQEPQQAKQIFWSPARDSHSTARDSHPREQYSQQAKEISHFPQQGSQSLQSSQSLMQNSQTFSQSSQPPELDPHLELSQSPVQVLQEAEKVTESLQEGYQSLGKSQFLVRHYEQAEISQSTQPSQSVLQVLQEAEKVTQSLQDGYQSLGKSQFLVRHYEQAEAFSQSTQPSQSAVHTSDQTEQVSHPSLHLSAHDPIAAEANKADGAKTSTPATNTTTPHLFISPPPTDPTFSLIYRKMPHRWTDLEPLEQALIFNYLLAKSHSPQRLHSQGYNPPRTVDTKSCLSHAEAHQHHLTPRPANPNSTLRKAIVLDCEMIETTVCTSELAFITAIDFLTGEVLINSYVTPTAPVTNWLTPVSGITQEKMDAAVAEGNVFVSNADARGALRKFLNHETVLIGHALQHDLRTLSLIHGRIVDTSVITSEAVFPNVSFKTTLPRIWGLETLAEELIGIGIRGGKEGQSSLEDALATREILIWCLRSPQCLHAWAERTRDSLAQMRHQRGARRNWGKKGGGANADKS